MTSFGELTASDIMRKALISARPDQPLAEVEHMLVDRHISGMPVIEDQRLVGVISRSDVARVQVLTEALDGQISDELQWDDTQADGFRHFKHEEFAGFRERFNKLKVRDVMRWQVVTCEPSTPVTEVAALLIRHHIHRVIVVDRDRPVGIVSSLDVVEQVAKSGAPAAK